MTTVSDRVMFTDTTNQVFGSFTKSDLESHLSLIRRKVQEKCGSIQELMAQVRRTKVGEGNSVTPVEFRYTLAKFGIMMTQAEVSRVFNVFDSDRSGTMDFDEFAMWIMNSEFQPKPKKVKKGPTFQEKLCYKLKKLVDSYPDTFQCMKAKLTFMEFLSMCTSKNMPVTEKILRSMFMEVDTHDSGVIEKDRLMEVFYTIYIQIP